MKNVHDWEGNGVFHECLHAELTLYQMKTKPWLKESSYAYAAIQRVVSDKNLLSDLKYLTRFSHTGTIEVYHYTISIFPNVFIFRTMVWFRRRLRPSKKQEKRVEI